MSDSVSPPSSHSPEEVPCRPEVPLETDDDDEPLLNFGGVGVGSFILLWSQMKNEKHNLVH